jgi:hypothetical protein
MEAEMSLLMANQALVGRLRLPLLSFPVSQNVKKLISGDPGITRETRIRSIRWNRKSFIHRDELGSICDWIRYRW